MSVSLKCGESILKPASVQRQISLFTTAFDTWPNPRVEACTPEEKKEVMQFVARDALYLTPLGIQELAAAEAELLAKAQQADSTTCGPCPNGGSQCLKRITVEGRPIVDLSEVDIISVQAEVQQPGNVQGIRIDFNYKLRGIVKVFCDPCDC